MRDANAPIWGEQAATRINLTASLITRLVLSHRHGTNRGDGAKERGREAVMCDRQVTGHHHLSEEKTRTLKHKMLYRPFVFQY